MSALTAAFRAKSRAAVAFAQRAPGRAPPSDGPPDATLELAAGGGTASHPISIPALAAMDALLVPRAALDLRGVAFAAPDVTATKGMGANHIQLQRPAPDIGEADLHELRIEGLTVNAGRLRLGSEDLGPAPEAPRKAHLVVEVKTGGEYGPPAAAAPEYGPPGGNSRYPSMLGGASVQTASNSAGVTATVTFNPPLRCSGVRVLLMREPEEDVSPVTSTVIAWAATAVIARWRSLPQQVDLALVAGSERQPLGAVPVLDGRLDLDLSGALAAMLTRQHEANPNAAPSVALQVTAKSQSRVEVRTSLQAWYRKQLPAAPDVLLRGSPDVLRRVSAAGVVPKACGGALHATWGPARLAASADRDDPTARAGVALQDQRRVARWVPLTAEEAGRPVLRLSVWARATADAELLLAACAGDPQIVGRQLGAPVSVPVTPSREPAWLRGDLTVDPAGRPGLWVVAWVSRGAVQVYGRAGACLISPDGGAAWSAAATQPLVQVHVQAAEGEAAPLALRAGATVVRADLRAEGPTGPRGMLVELAPLLTPAHLKAATNADGVLTLGLVCDQDVDLRPVDLALLYDPWGA